MSVLNPAFGPALGINRLSELSDADVASLAAQVAATRRLCVKRIEDRWEGVGRDSRETVVAGYFSESGDLLLVMRVGGEFYQHSDVDLKDEHRLRTSRASGDWGWATC